MNILQIKLAIVSVFLMTSFVAEAQSNSAKSTSAKQRTDAKAEIKATQPSVAIAQQTKRSRVSDYMSMEKKIMAMTIAGDIPASLPKHKEGQTKEEYKLIVRNWAKNNLKLIKKEYHAKLMAAPKAPKTK